MSLPGGPFFADITRVFDAAGGGVYSVNGKRLKNFNPI